MVRIKTQDGGGWLKNWTEKYNKGHRGLIGFALEVEDIEDSYNNLIRKGIKVTSPEHLSFRWFFNVFKKTMPWRNSYITEFEGIPFQFFLQQLNDEKSKKYMQQYMVPNSVDEAINGISEVKIYGSLTENDRILIRELFESYIESEGKVLVTVANQSISFIESEKHYVEVILDCKNNLHKNKQINIANVNIINR